MTQALVLPGGTIGDQATLTSVFGYDVGTGLLVFHRQVTTGARKGQPLEGTMDLAQ